MGWYCKSWKLSTTLSVTTHITHMDTLTLSHYTRHAHIHARLPRTRTLTTNMLARSLTHSLTHSLTYSLTRQYRPVILGLHFSWYIYIRCCIRTVMFWSVQHSGVCHGCNQAVSIDRSLWTILQNSAHTMTVVHRPCSYAIWHVSIDWSLWTILQNSAHTMTVVHRPCSYAIWHVSYLCLIYTTYTVSMSWLEHIVFKSTCTKVVYIYIYTQWVLNICREHNASSLVYTYTTETKGRDIYLGLVLSC